MARASRHALQEAALAAIRAGARTSPRIAELLGRPTRQVSKLCWEMERKGLLVRGPIVRTGAKGRPMVEWRIGVAAKGRPPTAFDDMAATRARVARPARP